MNDVVAERVGAHFEAMRMSADDLLSMATRLCEEMDRAKAAVAKGKVSGEAIDATVHFWLGGLGKELWVCEGMFARWSEARAIRGAGGRHLGDAGHRTEVNPDVGGVTGIDEKRLESTGIDGKKGTEE